jgi:hypothetical protein
MSISGNIHDFFQVSHSTCMYMFSMHVLFYGAHVCLIRQQMRTREMSESFICIPFPVSWYSFVSRASSNITQIAYSYTCVAECKC